MQLPAILSPVLIDGYTQPGSSPNTNSQGALNTVLKIVLSAANSPTTGLSFSGGSEGSTVRGLVVNGGWNYGIVFFSDSGSVCGCFVGTNAAGTAVRSPPNVRGIESDGGDDFIAGGFSPADRNLVLGNTQSGITAFHGSNKTIQGNLVGTDISGAASAPQSRGSPSRRTRRGR